VIRRDLNSCVDEASESNTHEFLEDADQAWSITRGKMRREFVWTFSHSARALRGYEAACPTSLYPPKQLVGSDSHCLGWKDVLSKVPDAQTAFASPDQSLILVLTKTQVLALRREVNGLATPFARVFLPVSEVLSAQWAIGKYATSGPNSFPSQNPGPTRFVDPKNARFGHPTIPARTRLNTRDDGPRYSRECLSY
jgi:hypothetical protein